MKALIGYNRPGVIAELVQRFESQDAVQELLRLLEGSSSAVDLSGLTGGSKCLLAAVLHLRLQRPVVIVTRNNREAEAFARDFRFFAGHAESPIQSRFFPSLDMDPYRGLPPHPTLAQQRASALWSFTQSPPPGVALPYKALMWRLPRKQELSEAGRIVRQGDWIDQEELITKLTDTGYVREEPVTEEGEFSRRGGIIDVFPPGSSYPVRMEFFGDEVVSLRSYDPETQRSIELLEQVAITPLREVLLGQEWLRKWAAAAEEAWGSRSYFSRLETQILQARQGESFPGAEFLLPLVCPLTALFFDYVENALFLIDEPDELRTETQSFEHRMNERYSEVGGDDAPVPAPLHFIVDSSQLAKLLDQNTVVRLRELGLADQEQADSSVHVPTQPVRKFQGIIRELIGDLSRRYESGERVLLVMSNPGRAERLQELLHESDLPTRFRDGVYSDPGADGTAGTNTRQDTGLRAPLALMMGDLSSGFSLTGVGWTLLGSTEIFGDSELVLSRRPKHATSRGTGFFSDFRDLRVGDFVVHVDHGIGQFQGLFQMGVGNQVRDFVLLHYRNEARLYIPVERLDLIEKYSSVGGAQPALDTLGGTSWQKTKSRIKKSMRDMAEELLRLYAQRNLVEGFAFSPDGPWQREFEQAFEFQETQDQSVSLSEIKRDMESKKPMDRLLCGDVGYGKTEVAIRASFKSVMDGKQVVVLAPTTILAFQHFNTFRDRFQAFPVRIEMLSRFRSNKEIKKILQEIEAGSVDIVIGTHRLLSKDVAFKDLGLVIVDEEQRFGVAHKERLKRLKTRVDVLTMTATPIPRTLHMSMMGIRDMSLIETPPKDRLSIQTSVLKYSPDVIKSAIELELARSGQVYFVHNRVESIYSMASLVQELCPQARIAVGHGQMSERELEEVMLKFVRHESDVLVATTIIENGLDIPRVNTIIVNRADRYGLAQLYQLRGRVGRSNRRAYAYLLVPGEDTLSTVARRRLAAIREFSDLGAGFRIAAMDLEIRGAGNLLGAEQHGQINAIGFDLYCQLLEKTVRELKGEEFQDQKMTSISLNMDIRIPESYVSDADQRLRLYKRISSGKSSEQLTALRDEIIDRYGDFPTQLDNLFAYAELRMFATDIGVESIERKDSQIHITFNPNTRLNPDRLLELVQSQDGLSFSPGGVLSVPNALQSGENPVQTVTTLLQKVL